MTPRHQPISLATKELLYRLLLEKISLAEIVRASGVSERWLQYYVNKKLGSVKRELEVKLKKKGKLTIQCDEREHLSYAISRNTQRESMRE